ncbi:hypothetical protein [Flavobacterium succinicans]|uniref:hypothetical protein n=1 Tax=Flavobacterium succinicans TaxID=29536 RepID=UPI00046823E1|nr:hypothetical protein [Flavobacterium succinicans]
MKNTILFTILALIFSSWNSYAQKAKVSSANKNYGNYAYVDAIQTYERLANKGYQSAEMFEKLGNAYYFNADFEKAKNQTSFKPIAIMIMK